jgi:hypothetical protein
MHKDRHVRIRGAGKTEPDVHRLSRALIALAMAKAKAEKDAEQQASAKPPTDKTSKDAPRRPT